MATFTVDFQTLLFIFFKQKNTGPENDWKIAFSVFYSISMDRVHNVYSLWFPFN